MGHGVACSTPQEVAEQSDYIFYCVGDSDMARSVTLGPDGLLQGVKPGTVVADCSTILPATSREIGKAFLARGAQFLDAPCTGSVPGAENATLTFMVGGDRNAFESAKPYLQMMGTNLFYCGGPGQGLHAKLAQNLILACMMEAFAEGIVLSTKAGLDPNLMLSILNSSAAKSGLIAYKAPFIFARNFQTNFSTKWMAKDVTMALEVARSLDIPLPITAPTEQVLRAAIAEGRGNDDFCSVVQTLERWAGITVEA